MFSPILAPKKEAPNFLLNYIEGNSLATLFEVSRLSFLAL